MDFLEAIPLLKTLADTEKMINALLPGVDFGQVDTFLKEALDIRAEIIFVDAETMPGTIEVEIDGVNYINLLPLFMLQEMVEEFANLEGKHMTDVQIANRIIEYSINDA
jgi:hypothetical protein